MRTALVLLLVNLFLLAQAGAAPAVSPRGEETLIIAGAGPSTAIVQAFFDHVAARPEARGHRFVVPTRSIKHAGGISSADENLFGRTGRPLTEAEKGSTKLEICLARIPLTFVMDPDMGVDSLTVEQLSRIISGQFKSWQDLGGPDRPIRLVGRESTEAAFLELKKALPALGDLKFDLVLKKDHQVVQLLQSPDRTGVLAFGALPNFEPAFHLQVTGFEAGLAVGLVHHVSNSNDPLVMFVKEYAVSDEWSRIVRQLGFLPAVHPLP